ncbi:MAG: hypothetical protein WDM85_02570 [Caulobacteraceae bacterium]
MTQPAAYHGPYLTWAGKVDSTQPAAQPDVAPSRAAASESEFAAWPAPAPGASRLHPTATTPAAYVAPPQARPLAPAVAAYVAPSAPPIHQSRPAQIAASAPPPAPAPAQPPTQVLAQNDTPAAAAQANPAPSTGVHYYSLHREYGLTPDQVTTPKDRPMVLIGPPDDPAPQKQDDADDNGRSAQHGGAEGADE